jgi:predicted deacylase
LAERIADTIFQTIIETEPAVVLDLHNDWIRSIPYTLLDPPSAGKRSSADRQSGSLAAQTGFLCVTEPDPLRRTLSHTLLRHGIAALTIELGESYVVNETNVELGVQSVFNVLQNLNMVARTGEPFAYPLPDEIRNKPVTYSQQPTSSTSGIIRFLVRPGTVVKGGQPVAKIVNAFGRHLETINVQRDAVVLGLSDSSVAYPGAPIMAFGQL